MARKRGNDGRKGSRNGNIKKKDDSRILFMGLICLLGVLVISVILVYTKSKIRNIAQLPAEPPKVTSKKPTGEPKPIKMHECTEVTPRERKPHPTCKVAIIIDDLGYDKYLSEEFLKIDAPLTFSIFPLCTYSKSIAEKAHAMGRDIMLHLPMEPYKYPEKDPGNGTLLLHMGNEEIIRILDADIRSVPFIKGVNNHMGSRFTESEEKMRVVLKELKERDLFFLDSKTSEKSVGYSIAKNMGLKAAGRNIFLDNSPDVEYIKAQIYKLARLSTKKGSAIAIGHPHPSTIEALKQTIPDLKAKGIEIVPISELVN